MRWAKIPASQNAAKHNFFESVSLVEHTFHNLLHLEASERGRKREKQSFLVCGISWRKYLLCSEESQMSLASGSWSGIGRETAEVFWRICRVLVKFERSVVEYLPGSLCFVSASDYWLLHQIKWSPPNQLLHHAKSTSTHPNLVFSTSKNSSQLQHKITA
jgi:hypothetical protein